MKKRMNAIAAGIAAAAVLCFPYSHSADAATIDEVISVSYEYGLFESNEKALRYALEMKNMSSENLDKVIATLRTGKYDVNALIVEQIDKGNIPVPDSEADSENQDGSTEGSFSEMTDEEKKEFVQNLSDSEKKEIIKNLDTDTQLEIIDSIIGVGSELGINVTLETLTDDKLEYSIRDENGQVLDITGMGNIVDNTGFDYTVLYISAAAVILLSSSGLIFMSKINSSKR